MMKLLYECPFCKKEFIQESQNLIGTAQPVRCTHCDEVSILMWNGIVPENDNSNSAQQSRVFFCFAVLAALVGAGGRKVKTKIGLTNFVTKF